MSDLERFNKISLRKYQVFSKILEYNDIKKASRHFKAPPFKLQNDIKSLEKTLGINLFERNKEEFTLTNEGQKFAHSAQKIVGKIHQIQKKRISESQELVISAYYGVAESILPKALTLFSKRHPTVRITVLAGIEYDDFTRTDLDVLIAAPLSNRADLKSTYLGVSPYYFYANSEYLKKFGTPNSFDGLKKHRLVSFKRLLHKTNNSFEQLKPNIQSSNFGFIYNMIKLGYGIGLLPISRLQNHNLSAKNIMKISIEEEYMDFSIHFLSRKFSEKAYLTKDLLECIMEILSIGEKNEKNYI